MRWRTNGLVHTSQVNSTCSFGDSANLSSCAGLGFAWGPLKPISVTIKPNKPYANMARRAVARPPMRIDSVPPRCFVSATGDVSHDHSRHRSLTRPLWVRRPRQHAGRSAGVMAEFHRQRGHKIVSAISLVEERTGGREGKNTP